MSSPSNRSVSFKSFIEFIPPPFSFQLCKNSFSPYTFSEVSDTLKYQHGPSPADGYLLFKRSSMPFQTTGNNPGKIINHFHPHLRFLVNDVIKIGTLDHQYLGGRLDDG